MNSFPPPGRFLQSRDLGNLHHHLLLPGLLDIWPDRVRRGLHPLAAHWRRLGPALWHPAGLHYAAQFHTGKSDRVAVLGEAPYSQQGGGVCWQRGCYKSGTHPSAERNFTVAPFQLTLILHILKKQN